MSTCVHLRGRLNQIGRVPPCPLHTRDHGIGACIGVCFRGRDRAEHQGETPGDKQGVEEEEGAPYGHRPAGSEPLLPRALGRAAEVAHFSSC